MDQTAKYTPHFLTMTATPIPRTLALTLYRDLDLSVLDEMPVGRQKIATHVVPSLKRNAAYKFIEKQIEENRQAFIPTPFVEPSETMASVKSATEEYKKLKTKFSKKVRLGLLHGRLKSKEKEKIIEEFKKNKINILVTTPVVEVGIDVPNATVMMIESADRFGLSQLHQLRGRVGRGEHKSYCFYFQTHALKAPQNA
jgi:ATP-dependent DNA helicase RecG